MYLQELLGQNPPLQLYNALRIFLQTAFLFLITHRYQVDVISISVRSSDVRISRHHHILTGSNTTVAFKCRGSCINADLAEQHARYRDTQQLTPDFIFCLNECASFTGPRGIETGWFRHSPKYKQKISDSPKLILICKCFLSTGLLIREGT